MAKRANRLSRNTGLWILAASLLAVLSVGLVLKGRGTLVEGAGLSPEVQSVSPTNKRSKQLESISRVSQVEPIETGYLDPLETLSDYWGDDWPEIEFQIFPDGLAAESLNPIVPWPEIKEIHLSILAPNRSSRVEALYRKLVSWPAWEFYGTQPKRPDPSQAKLTPKSLSFATRDAAVRELNQSEVESLELHFSSINSELDSLARVFIDGIGEVVRFEFMRDTVERAPFAFLDQLDRKEDELYSHKVTAGGWVTRVQIEASQYPDLAQIKGEIDALRQRRSDELQAAVEEIRTSRSSAL